LSVSRGGTGSSSFTAGSVVFSDGTVLTENNTNLFWDDTNNRLGIGSNTPSSTLTVLSPDSIAAYFQADVNGGIQINTSGGGVNLKWRNAQELFRVEHDGTPRGWDFAFSMSSGIYSRLDSFATVNRTYTFPDFTGRVPLTAIPTGLFTTGSVLFADSNGLIDEDSASFFWDSANNRLGIGTASPVNQIHVSSSMTAFPRGIMSSQHNTGIHAAVYVTRKSRGTEVSPLAVTSGDFLGVIIPEGYDGAAYQFTGLMGFIVDGAVSGGTVPTAYVVYTGSSGGGSERLRVTSSGNVGIGGTPGAFKLDVFGDAQIQGKLTVTGGIDPTFLELAGTLSDTYLNITGGSSVAVSPANQGRIRYNEMLQSFQVSENGGAWADLSVGGNAFLQNGNSFGGTATLGTNDAFDLVFEVNNSERARLLVPATAAIGSLFSLGGAVPASFEAVVNAGTPEYPTQGMFLGSAEAISRGTIGIRDNAHFIQLDAGGTAAGNDMLCESFGGYRFTTGVGSPTGGTLRMIIVGASPSFTNPTGALAEGNIGIGTASPLTHLHVSGTGDQEISIQSVDVSGRRWTIQSTGAGVNVGKFQIIDRTAGLSRLLIDSTGKVTIPGILDPTQVLLSGGDKKFGATDAGTVYLAPFANATSAVQIRNVAGTSILNADSTNLRIGIGTILPSQALDVQGGSINTSVNLMTAGVTRISAAGAGTFAGGLTSPTLTNAGTLALSATGANVVTLATNGVERLRAQNSQIISISGGASSAAFNTLVGANASIFMGGAGAAAFIGVSDDSHHIKFDSTANAMTFNEFGDFIWKTSGGGGTERMRLLGGVTTPGRLGLGTSTPGFQLHLSTDSAAKPTSNTWTISSDSRLKDNITPFADGLSVLKQINPVQYTLNGKANTPLGAAGIGIIAQDMLSVIPYTISTYKARLEPTDELDTDIYSFNSSALTFVTINALKELDSIISPIFNRDVSSIIAPGTNKAKIRWEDGTVPGTLKLVAYAGVSTTGVTIVDNVGL
jgi:hypothetical protein